MTCAVTLTGDANNDYTEQMIFNSRRRKSTLHEREGTHVENNDLLDYHRTGS